MSPDFSSSSPAEHPLFPVVPAEPQPETPQIPSAPTSRPLARWRWWVALIFAGAFPIVAALTSTLRTSRNGGGEAMLPSSVWGLVLGGVIQFGFIMIFLGVSWLFSRATKGELWLHWRKGIAPIWQGALYSIGLRILSIVPVIMALIVAAIVLTSLGKDPKVLTEWMQSNRPQTEGLGNSVRAGSTLYKLIVLTFFSFIVAGLGEELWRVATMRGLLEVLPHNISPAFRTGLTVTISAVVFGIGHLYQGLVGVGVTAILGIALGLITLHHRSVWPAVIAHGCFDASTFLAVVLGLDKIAEKASKAAFVTLFHFL